MKNILFLAFCTSILLLSGCSVTNNVIDTIEAENTHMEVSEKEQKINNYIISMGPVIEFLDNANLLAIEGLELAQKEEFTEANQKFTEALELYKVIQTLLTANKPIQIDQGIIHSHESLELGVTKKIDSVSKAIAGYNTLDQDILQESVRLANESSNLFEDSTKYLGKYSGYI